MTRRPPPQERAVRGEHARRIRLRAIRAKKEREREQSDQAKEQGK